MTQQSRSYIVGRRVYKLRRDLDWTQAELARRVGIDRTYISLIENNKAEGLTLEHADRLAKVLGVSLGYILGLEDGVVSEHERDIESVIQVLEELNGPDREQVRQYAEFLRTRKRRTERQAERLLLEMVKNQQGAESVVKLLRRVEALLDSDGSDKPGPDQVQYHAAPLFG